MPRAIIIGGTGAIGYAVARRLLASGWEVDVTGRDPSHMPTELAEAGGRFVILDRDDSAGLVAVLGGGADLLLDCVCYTATHAAALLPLLSSVNSAVMVSTKAVYVDANGRHTNSEVPPAFIGPITESQPTVRPNRADYKSREGYGPNKVAAEEILLETIYPVTVLRVSKVHGAWSRQPREWVFIKRILDRRPVVVLAKRGAGVDHPSAAANVAALVEVVARNPGKRILNSADPDAPSALEISRAIATYMGHTWEEVLLAGGGPFDVVGRTPWDAVPPIVLDMSAAVALGYQPAGTYPTCVRTEIDWLVAASREAATAWAMPAHNDSYFGPLLDYAAEDNFLSMRAANPA